MISPDLEKKIKQSIRLLQSACKGKQVEIAYSGGKDSDVILQLAKEACIDFVPIYKCITIDPPLTKRHALDNMCKVIMPKKSFFELVAENGLPNRRRRFCCSVLKEYKIMDDVILGIRRSESSKRAKRYKEPIMCRNFRKGEHVNQILPILEWSNNDVAEFIADRGIKCHPLYYDDDGTFHVERRLGCIGCPLSRKGAMEGFTKYPKFVRAYINAADKFLKKGTRISHKVKNGAELFYFVYFCDSFADFFDKTSAGLFGDKPDIKQYLESKFNVILD